MVSNTWETLVNYVLQICQANSNKVWIQSKGHYWIIEHVPFIFLRHKVLKGIFGYKTHNLSSKCLERLKGTTINQADEYNNSNGNDINA